MSSKNPLIARFKRLIIASDGTWQASDKPKQGQNVESNVTRMARALKENRFIDDNQEIQQIVYYQSGVGTNVLGAIGATIEGAIGAGLDDNVISAYNFICLNYDAVTNPDGSLNELQSDEIFLFGFSRGAYTARSLGGFISTIGILKKSVLKKVGSIYAQYQKDNKRPPELNPEDFKVRPEHVKIKVIGVFDTVGSLGVPDAWFTATGLREKLNKRYSFHDPEVSTRVENAFHALALDEHRRPFSPTLWHLPDSNQTTNLIQCWFPGVHINLGGGSTDEITEGRKEFTDLGELSNISFAWMVDLCQDFLEFDEQYLENITKGHLEVMKELKLRMSEDEITQGGWAQGMINDSFDGQMAAAGSRTRAPGQYDESNKILTAPPKFTSRTNEYIHPSARVRITKRFERVGKKVWRRQTDQVALAGFQMEYRENPGIHESGLFWVKDCPVIQKQLAIPEYQILGVRDGKTDEHRELDLLDPIVCSEELEMVTKPQNHLKTLLPPPPEPSEIEDTWRSLYKFTLGGTPQQMHFWENEQSFFDKK